ncbi:MAG: 4-hydroxythreonine-4-phosphate dehydrogenase PdxA [Alphaproteobacteria bacterium]|nr:4-hydroxythreonine-4-phosphate dehydrogenase PdxA [Alphaproteobacteria bacterium]
MKPRIAVIHGEPAGIGPELIAKLLGQPDIAEHAEIILVGDRHVFELGQRQARTHWPIGEVDPEQPDTWKGDDGIALIAMQSIQPDEIQSGVVSEAGGRASLRGLDRAIDLTLAGLTDAVLFAPFNKAALHLAGMGVEDEHRYIARYLEFSGYHSEINMLDDLITTRVTSHIALKDVAAQINIPGVIDAIRLAHETLLAMGIARPRIGLAALNPHAGDDGNFGTEEIEILAPAVERARSLQINVDGPWPSDTVFLKGRDGLLDAVVTMYHDQGQIAMKLLGFESGVTIAAGLPIPVATPAHGTAFDISGQGIANVGATRKAFDVLCRMGARYRSDRVASPAA